MKRILILILVLSLTLSSALVFSSCGKDDEEEVKTIISDPDRAGEALERSGFNTYVYKSGAELDFLESEYGISGLNALVSGMGNNTEENDRGEMILIFYFASEADRKSADEKLEPLFADTKSEYHQEGYPISAGAYKNIKWIGTDLAIDVASGGVATGIDPDVFGDQDEPADVYIPAENYKDAAAYLEEMEYEVSLVDDPESLSHSVVEGLSALINASRDTNTDGIFIFYFTDLSYVDAGYELMLAQYEEQQIRFEEAGMEWNMIIGIYDNIVWMGSPEAVRAASGEDSAK